MKRVQVTCGNCSGVGRIGQWETVSTDTETGVSTMKRTEIVCENCNGKGYTEDAIFSIEEAEAILKHCGLAIEN